MKIELYKKRLQELKKEYDEKVWQLQCEYAIDNNNYKVGDLFRDHIGVIRIEKIDVEVAINDTPACVYEGEELKMDGTPRKKISKRKAWQINETK